MQLTLAKSSVPSIYIVVLAPGLNSTELRGEQLPPDGKSDHDENDEIPNTLNSEIHISPNSLNNEIHIPTNTISSIEPTNDEPKTAFDTANSINVELNSTVEPNNFDEKRSNSIKNELNIIDGQENIDDDEIQKFSSEQPEFESKSEPELEANISDHDDSDFGDFERSEVPGVSQVNDVKETFKTNVNKNYELQILDELPKTEKKQAEETLNDEINSIDAYVEDLEKINLIYQRAPSQKVEIEDPQIESKVYISKHIPI